MAALLLPALLSTACRREPRVLPLGTGVEPGPAGASRSLVWVVPAAEFRTCGSVAADLRAAQVGRAGSLPLTVVFVGLHPEWMAAYLRSQRLVSSLVPLSRADYERRFGYGAVSALYLVDHRRISRALGLGGVGDAQPFLREVTGGAGDGRAADATEAAGRSSLH